MSDTHGKVMSEMTDVQIKLNISADVRDFVNGLHDGRQEEVRRILQALHRMFNTFKDRLMFHCLFT